MVLIRLCCGLRIMALILQAGPAVEEVGTWRKLEELFKIEHPVPEADQEGLTAAVGTNAVVYKNEESSSVKAESSSAFNITVGPPCTKF